MSKMREMLGLAGRRRKKRAISGAISVSLRYYMEHGAGVSA